MRSESFEAESAGAAAWVLLAHGTVICPSRDYTSHSSSRIGVVARPPRNEMNVTVHHSLTGDLSAVDSYVKALDFIDFVRTAH